MRFSRPSTFGVAPLAREVRFARPGGVGGLARLACLGALSLFAAACASSPDAKVPARPPLASKWLDRAQTSFKNGDFEDAHDAAKSALQAAPNDPEVKLINAR